MTIKNKYTRPYPHAGAFRGFKKHLPVGARRFPPPHGRSRRCPGPPGAPGAPSPRGAFPQRPAASPAPPCPAGPGPTARLPEDTRFPDGDRGSYRCSPPRPSHAGAGRVAQAAAGSTAAPPAWLPGRRGLNPQGLERPGRGGIKFRQPGVRGEHGVSGRANRRLTGGKSLETASHGPPPHPRPLRATAPPAAGRRAPRAGRARAAYPLAWRLACWPLIPPRPRSLSPLGATAGGGGERGGRRGGARGGWGGGVRCAAAMSRRGPGVRVGGGPRRPPGPDRRWEGGGLLFACTCRARELLWRIGGGRFRPRASLSPRGT